MNEAIEPRYEIRGAGKANATGLTLYEACARLAAEKTTRGADSAHIWRNGRYIAFWAPYYNEIRPMWQATDGEKRAMPDMRHRLGARANLCY